jgi:threonyl-tRNA synthetase
MQTYYRSSSITASLYIDFAGRLITEADIPAIEKKKMIEIARAKHELECGVSKADAGAIIYKDQNNPFKVELIENLTDGRLPCERDTFTDLLRWTFNTGIVKANES